MQCGHCFCLECMRIMQERASCGRQSFSVKCAICRQASHQSEISYVVTSQKYEGDELKVKVGRVWCGILEVGYQQRI